MYRNLILTLATGLGLGYFPKFPGSIGTLLAIPLYYLFTNLDLTTYCVTLVAFIGMSIWVSNVASQFFEEEDSSHIVIDEVAGFLVTLSFHPFNWVTIIAGYILFRFFDISKWFGVGTIEKRCRGGVGIVLDDVLAGIWASICLFGIEYLI